MSIVIVVLTLFACSSTCPDLAGTPCAYPGHSFYQCDECGDSWACYSTGEWQYTDITCDCIDEEGRHELGDSGCGEAGGTEG